METLEQRYKDDPGLLAFYQRKLLIPGWAGEVDDVEAVYIAGELRRRPSLRKQWRVAQFTRKRKAISYTVAKRLVIWLAEILTRSVKLQYSGTVKTNKSSGKAKRVDGIQASFLAALEQGNG